MSEHSYSQTADTMEALVAQHGKLERAQWLAQLREDMQARQRRGDEFSVESYLQARPALVSNAEATLDLIYLELTLREEAGETPSEQEYRRRFPQWAELIERQFALHQLLDLDAEESGSLHTTEAFTLEGTAVPASLQATEMFTLPPAAPTRDGPTPSSRPKPTDANRDSPPIQ